MAEIATGQMSELAALDAEIQGVYGHLGELLARRSALAQPAGEACLAGADVSLDWLSVDYDLTKSALSELGFSKQVLAEEVPAFEQVTAGINGATAIYLNAQTGRPELVLRPRIQDIGLKGTRRAPGLITRFDKKQGEDDKTYVWTPLWDRFDDKSALHDNGVTEAWSAGVLLNDTTDPRDSSKPANRYDEAGLVFTGLKVADQRDALKDETEAHWLEGRQLVSADLADIVIVNAKRRLEGKPLLDQRTVTRLTHYPDTPVGVAYVPSVVSDGRRVGLVRSYVQSDWDDYGVRRVLRVPAKA